MLYFTFDKVLQGVKNPSTANTTTNCLKIETLDVKRSKMPQHQNYLTIGQNIKNQEFKCKKGNSHHQKSPIGLL